MSINHLSKTEPKWFAIYTNFKREKVVLSALEEKGIEAYLPLQKTVRIYKSRKKKVELPLLTCYVFVRITEKEYISVLETSNVLNFVKIGCDLFSIPDEEIDLLRHVTGEEGYVLQRVEGFPQAGDRVEIIAGALRGTKGTLISAEGQKRFVLRLENLDQYLSIKIDPDFLLKI
ncbi:MAG: UpxY family transcription antiterminator [Bacteroidota bacterium]